MSIVTYLLHIDPPVGQSRHYIGSTLSDRLNVRLTEHSMGRGAALTARAAAQGSTLYFVRFWATSDRTLELRLKSRHRASSLCPICRSGLSMSLFRAYPARHHDLARGTPWNASEWP